MDKGHMRTDVILLTGFLASGKTTLLNRLIGAFKGKRLAVIVNEFGTAGIDAARLQPGGYNLFELNRGSLFCICVRTDFIDAVRQAVQNGQPDLLLIEATGIADTTEMERVFAIPEVSVCARLKTVICLVDPLTYKKVSFNLKAPAVQVEKADLIIINKVDLVPETEVDELAQELRILNVDAPILRAVHADVPLEMLTGMERREKEESMPGAGRPDAVSSITLISPGEAVISAWKDFRSGINADVLRLKGYLNIDGRRYYIDETAGQTATMEPLTDDMLSDNVLVIIGRGLSKKDLEESFARMISGR